MNEGRRLSIDIEGNCLLADALDYTSLPYRLKPSAKLWTIAITDIDTGEVFCQNNEGITREWLKESLKGCTVLIAHNGIKFDFVVLNLFGLFDYRIGYLAEPDTIYGDPVQVIDTLVLSRLFNPDRFGGHSLDSWGKRTGDEKIHFRQVCIEKGVITKDAPQGAEFLQWIPEMDTYCIKDTKVTGDTFKILKKEWDEYPEWSQAIKQENKLADLGVRRETFGFWFDKDLALKCIEDLTEKMDKITQIINPILPPKPMTKGELSEFIPPKNQLTIKNLPTANLLKFAARIGSTLTKEEDIYHLNYKGSSFQLPYHEPLETHLPATIDNLDHVKMYLMDLGWEPTEWRERDLTKDSKKQNLPLIKRIAALDKWWNDTQNGKYKEARIKYLELPEDKIYEKLREKIKGDKPVRIPTAPTIRVGVEKELCPNLIKLGDKVSFAKDFAYYLTYKHRKSSIAGGDIEDMDFDNETPNTGFLSMYREEDGRVPTPAIELGASTSRYRHIGVCNIPRASSIYGKEIRSLFGSGPAGSQEAYDFSSLEARIEGHYIWKYTKGQELAKSLLAEKPNDIHSVNAAKLGIPRPDAKALTYGILYGAQPAKIAKMLNIPISDAKEIYTSYWEAVPALKELKESVELFWNKTGKTYILGIDGRKILIRSQHSILNALFQSAGVICAKYVTISIAKKLEEQGLNINPFSGVPDICEMISYHDEAQYFILNKYLNIKTFSGKEEAKQFEKEWKGEFQLSAISEGSKWYCALPNNLSMAIETSIREVEKQLKLNVPLGYEWITNKNWYMCH